MATSGSVTTLSELIHRAVSSRSCLNLNHPLSLCGSPQTNQHSTVTTTPSSSSSTTASSAEQPDKDDAADEGIHSNTTAEAEELMEEVFSAVSAMKRAYVSLQAAHSPWDPERIRTADESVVAELSKLSRLKDIFRRRGRRHHNPPAPPPLREAVIPYEAALRETKKALKAKEAEIENLKEQQLKKTKNSPISTQGKKGSRRRSSRFCSSSSSFSAVATRLLGPNPTPELFCGWMEEKVKPSLRAFGTLFTAWLKQSGGVETTKSLITQTVESHHTRHAIEAYVNKHTFEGFENESFYMDGSLSSLLDPSGHRRTCFSQFRSMLSIAPSELLGVLPTCAFGTWAAGKYRSIVGRPTEGEDGMTRSLYGEFLEMAKAVWMLHLLAFAMEAPAAAFEATDGAPFRPEFMESVVRFHGGQVPVDWVVGFGVGPGFRVGDGSVVRARVYPLPPPPPPNAGC